MAKTVPLRSSPCFFFLRSIFGANRAGSIPARRARPRGANQRYKGMETPEKGHSHVLAATRNLAARTCDKGDSRERPARVTDVTCRGAVIWTGSINGECGGLKIRRDLFDSSPVHQSGICFLPFLRGRYISKCERKRSRWRYRRGASGAAYPEARAEIAQRQSRLFVMVRLWVRFPLSAPKAMHKPIPRKRTGRG